MPPIAVTDGSWLPIAAVLEQTGVKAGSADEAGVDRRRVATAAFVERHRRDLAGVDLDGTPTFTPTPDVVEGAILLAARLHARKGSPTGIASYGEFGPAAVLRFDPDIDRLLGIGRSVGPVIG